MSRVQQVVVFLVVVSAVAAVTVLTGAGSTLSLAAVGAGFLLLHLFALYGVGRLQRLTQAAATAGNVKSGSSTNGGATVSYKKQSYLKTPHPAARKTEYPDLSEFPEADDVEIIKDTDSDPAEDDVSLQDISVWLEHGAGQTLAGSDDEEISFLPPFASDTVETDPDGADAAEEDENWSFSGAENAMSGESAVPGEVIGNVPLPRHFALGTVAIIRNLLEPEQVAKVMLEQRHQPKLRFGEIAIELGFLTSAQVEELLVAQKGGLFTDEEIHEARVRLRTFRELEGTADDS
jgi:hypothetical protein